MGKEDEPVADIAHGRINRIAVRIQGPIARAGIGLDDHGDVTIRGMPPSSMGIILDGALEEHDSFTVEATGRDGIIRSIEYGTIGDVLRDIVASIDAGRILDAHVSCPVHDCTAGPQGAVSERTRLRRMIAYYESADYPESHDCLSYSILDIVSRISSMRRSYVAAALLDAACSYIIDVLDPDSGDTDAVDNIPWAKHAFIMSLFAPCPSTDDRSGNGGITG